MAMHAFNNHSRVVYNDHPSTCVLDPPTRSRNSSESGERAARWSSVMWLLASPFHQAPTQ